MPETKGNKKRSAERINQAETNSENKEVTNEFNSYNSYSPYLNYFGMNVFDMYTPEQIKAMVQNPMGCNEMLREASIILYGQSGIYSNTVDYMTAMPTLDKVIVPHGKNAAKKRRNKELMESTLRQIKDKEFVRDALFRGMIEGIAFFYFETTSRPLSNKKMMTDYDVQSISEINELGINASIISLPADYTQIVGIKNSSYVIAFNLDYFDISDGEPGEKKIKKYPKEIRDAYSNKNNGNSSGNWVVLDNTKTIVHKIRSKREEKYGRPLVLAAINDILYSEYFTQTKRGVLDEINNKIIYQTFPEGKDKGTSALTGKQQENQHNAVKSAVMHKNNRGGTSFFSVAAGTKIDSIDAANTDIFDDKYESNLGEKIATDLGIASSLLNGSSSGSYSTQENNLELLTAQIFMWIEGIQSELNKCISCNIINDTKNWVEVKYLPITHVNKDKLISNAKELYLSGKGSLGFWASAVGLSQDVFYAMLDEELEEDVENKYPVHKTSFNLSSGEEAREDKGGRPMTENPTNNTVASRNNNGNAIASPSDKK